MRKLLVSLCVLALAVCGTSTLFASGIDNLSNMSADFIRTMNRTHSTDLDAVQYNPAGTTALKKGLSIGLNVQQVYKTINQKISDNDWATNQAGKSIWWTGSASGTAPGGAVGGTVNTSNSSAYEEFKSDVPSTIPSLFMAYNTGDFAAFFAFDIVAGGGKVAFEEGAVYLLDFVAKVRPFGSTLGYDLAPTGVQNLKLEAESQYYAFMAGGAYNIIPDLLSVSLGGRFILAEKKNHLEGGVGVTTQADPGTGSPSYCLHNYNIDKYDSYEVARGFGGIIGLNITPTKEMRVALRYETVTRLMFKNHIRNAEFSSGGWSGNTATGNATVHNTLLSKLVPLFTKNDEKYAARDLPPVLSLGLSYDVTPEMKVFASGTYYIVKDARWQTYDRDDTDSQDVAWYARGDKKMQKKYENSYDGGLGIEYAVTKELKLSVGWLYTYQGQSEGDIGVAAENPATNSNTIGAGFQFDAGSGLLVSFGLSNTIYQERKTTYYTDKWHNDLGSYSKNTTSAIGGAKSVTFNRTAWTAALGVTYNLAM